MDQLPASRTAVRVALQRAVHQVLDDEPRVFIDPVAVGLFPEATEAARPVENAICSEWEHLYSSDTPP